MIDLERVIRDYGVTIRRGTLIGLAGLTRKTPSGYLILINKDLAHSAQMETLEHEILHVLFGHLDDRDYLAEWEKEAEVEADWLWKCERCSKEVKP